MSALVHGISVCLWSFLLDCLPCELQTCLASPHNGKSQFLVRIYISIYFLLVLFLWVNPDRSKEYLQGYSAGETPKNTWNYEAVFFFLKIGTWTNVCCQSCLLFFSLLLPKSPQYIVVYSSCECLWLSYVGCCLNMAWWAVPCLCPGSEPAKPWAAEAEHATLTTRPQGRPLIVLLKHLKLYPVVTNWSLIKVTFFIDPKMEINSIDAHCSRNCWKN